MEVEIGRITHYYDHINVAVLLLSDSLKLGDKVHIHGHVSDFTQRVASMEVDRQPVVSVRPGEEAAIKVTEPVREHDIVYRIFEEELEPHHA